MMWYDDKKTELFEKIDEGVAHFRLKYELEPNMVRVPPDDLALLPESGECAGAQVVFRPDPYVLPYHVYIGVCVDLDLEGE